MKHIAMQTGLERCVKMGMIIGLWVWVFQNRAYMDKNAWHFYLTVRK